MCAFDDKPAHSECPLTKRLFGTGQDINFSTDLMGRFTSSPQQFGQISLNNLVAQPLQNVHSKEHITALAASAGKPALQHSQFGLILSIDLSRFNLSSQTITAAGPIMDKITSRMVSSTDTEHSAIFINHEHRP